MFEYLKKHHAGFTLIEIMITIIILGIIAAFAIPNYTNMVDRAREKDGRYNLELLREAVRLYAAHHDGYPADLEDVDSINTALNLHIIEQENNMYRCFFDAPDEFECYAYYDPDGIGAYDHGTRDGSGTGGGTDPVWALKFHLNDEIDVCCAGGSCPSINNC